MSSDLRRAALSLKLLVVLALFAAACGGPTPKSDAPIGEMKPVKKLKVVPWKGTPGKEWKEFDALVGEQKFTKAGELIEPLLERAIAAKDSEQWVRGLLRVIHVQSAQSSFEKAVRYLKEQPWPTDLLGHTVLHLYYAAVLQNYAQSSSWEIRQREQVTSKGKVDLKAWTWDQIQTEVQRAYEAVWVHRGQLGDQPAKHLGEYLKPNNYPREIRHTLRDAVSYLWAALLNNSSSWRPEHTNELFRLDLPALLGGAPGAKEPARVALADPEVHPLRKVSAMLLDLERWHLGRKAAEAAFEARLTLLRALHTHFTRSEDRKLIADDLRARLPAIKGHPWWSMGMAALAEFARQEVTPDKLIRAREIALQGHRAFPESIGGKRCLSSVGKIEKPEYRLEAMTADGPRQRSIGVTYKNLERVYFRAYPVDLKRSIKRSKDYNLLPQNEKLERLVESHKPAHQWDAALPRTIDYEQHRVDVATPIKAPGYYVIVASGRADFAKKGNVLAGVYMAISDLVLITRQERDGKLHVEARSGSKGTPVAGARVQLYRLNYNSGHSVTSSVTTGRGGTAVFDGVARGHGFILLARKGAQVALDPRHRSIYEHKVGKRTSTLIYTDRSVYRPLQKIHFKSVLFAGRSDRADYKALPGAKLTIKLMDANHQEVAKTTVTTNTFGTASGSFEIPQGRLLGSWHLQSSQNGQAYFKVEEYKRPTFEVKLPGGKTPLRLNKPASFKGEARYLFGLPVTSGAVTWRVTRTPVYPWWYHHRWSRGGGSRVQTVATGKEELAADGTFTVSFTPRADERAAKESREISYRYNLTADVTDEGGESRTASRGFRLGFVAVEASINAETGFYLERQGGKMTVRRSNLDGEASPGAGKYHLFRLKEPPRALLPVEQPLPKRPGAVRTFSTADDKRRKRWAPGYDVDSVLRGWADGPVKAQGKLTHGKDGEASVSLPGLAAGVYRLRYTTKDAFGAPFKTAKEFVVAGKKAKLALPSFAWVERPTAKVGQRARIFVGSGLAGQVLTVDTFRGGLLAKRRMVRVGRDDALIEIPITEKDRGGFGLVVLALRDHQLMSFHHKIFVPWENKELKVGFSTFRDRLRPGTKEKWTVKVTGPGGKKTPARAAEVLAYMYDRSLDVFAPHHTPAPLDIFPRRTEVAGSSATVGPGRSAYLNHFGFKSGPSAPSLRVDALKFWANYGVGGVGRINAFASKLRRSSGRPPPAPPRSKPEPEPPSERAPQPRPAQAKNERTRTASTTESDKSTTPGYAELGSAAAGAPTQLRQNFSETAFFEPHLLTGADGSVSFEFEVPDSVTSWNVWAHAITRDFKSGSVKKETRSVKELMVRPYLPRFLREGDRATIKVVVNNASKKQIKGQLKFDIIDPKTQKSVLKDFGVSGRQAAARPFTVKAGGGTNLSFPIVTPSRVGLVAFRVVASSRSFSDGELRPIPLLPGRIHLAQSRFVTLKDKDQRKLHFADLKRDDDSTRINEQMVVTIDGQLFYSVLSALPYLVNYPYECTEQTLNRFISTGILSSMYKDYPAIERMARTFAARKTRLERWDQSDPNRKMALEETPWLQQAQGGEGSALVNVLDPRITRAQRNASLAKLKKSQTSLGGFPWFPGGPPSPTMTLYILYGLSKGLEFKVDIPKAMVQRAWRYLKRHYIDKVAGKMRKGDCCWEFISFLNYALSNYPDDSWSGGVFSKAERKKMLDFSFRHWKAHSPYLKGYLALTLNRVGRARDARLVWESVMDSAQTKRDQGTFWAPEARSWLWYNDTIETHAFAIRTELELRPKSSKLDGLVLWIFLNKKLNHWKSTRATAEVIYSLATYLKKTAQLGQREAISVAVGDLKREFVFSPDKYTGKKNQLVIEGKQLNPKKHATVVVKKTTRGMAFASATWHFSTERLPKEARGDFLAVSRKYFLRVKTGPTVKLQPLKEGARVEVGAEVEVQLTLKAKHAAGYVHLRDPRPAGFEPTSSTSRHRWNLGIYWYEEIRDSGTNFFFEQLPQGEYPFKYRLRATTAGTFKASPATVQPMYAPEFTGYSAGSTIKIHPSK